MRLPKKSDLTQMTDAQLDRLVGYISDEKLNRGQMLAQERRALAELETLSKKYKLTLPTLARMVT